MNASTIIATVENGVIKLPRDAQLPDGTRVQIEPETPPRKSLAERYGSFAGIADDLPSDLAANLDHYLHGQPRKE